jgi:hypothetical protein
LAAAAVMLLLVPLIAVLGAGTAHAAVTSSCGPGSSSSGAACTITATDATHTRIDQPFVEGPSYEYTSVLFQPGDRITIDAGGCVQTGGSGETWKRYVNPTGSGSGWPGGLYWGWVTIPGAVFADNPNQPVTHVPIGSFTGGLQHDFIVPDIGQSTDFAQPLDLIVGYTDDEYDDNGYYSHDDGNDNQCALDHDGGPAHLNLAVQHGVAGPMPAVNPKPFDIVPQGYDSNRMFKNPVWGWQFNHGGITTDGNYFPRCGQVDPCTSQVTDEDRIGWDLFEIFGLCGGDPPTGHRNWFDVTYNGAIDFEEHAGGIGGDDDYNMRLKAADYQGTGPAGISLGNPDDVKLEFDSDETIDHFDHQQWWAGFHAAVDDDDNGALDAMVNGHDAVVIGLMGIDQVHAPGGTEIHPVHVLAVRESAPGSVNPASDSWALFARNWGNEGECGSQQHYLDANSITVDLPRPGNAPAGAAASLVGNNDFIAHGTNNGPAVHNSSGGVQVTFTLPNGSNKPWVAGEVHLNWTGHGAAPGTAATAATAPTAHTAAAPAGPARVTATGAVRPADDEEGQDPEEVIAGMFEALTPAQQQAANSMFAQLRPPATQDSETTAAAHLTSAAPAFPASVPTVSQAYDPIAVARLHAQFQSLCAASGGSLPGQPTWCPTLNQPPVTLLTTSGGAPGTEGWATSPVTATLTGYDAGGSGLDRTEYSYDGQSWQQYTGPFVLAEGAYTLQFRSVDKRGSIEQAKQRAFKIDSRPPSATASLNPPANSSGWIAADGTVTLHATDPAPGSGVATLTYSTSGAQTASATTVPGDTTVLTVTREGETTVTFHSTDHAGNAGPDRTLTVRVDKSPPASAITTADHTIYVAVVIGGPDTQRVTGTATDNAAGVDHVSVTYTAALLGGTTTARATVTCTDTTRRTCTWALPPPPGIGIYTVTAVATDRAGNIEPAHPGIHITVVRLLL